MEPNYREGSSFELDDGLAVGVGSFRIDKDRPPTSLRGSRGQPLPSRFSVIVAMTLHSHKLKQKMTAEVANRIMPHVSLTIYRNADNFN